MNIAETYRKYAADPYLGADRAFTIVAIAIHGPNFLDRDAAIRELIDVHLADTGQTESLGWALAPLKTEGER